MKNLIHVLQFELGNYFKSKSFIISTVLICLLAIVGLSLPGILAGTEGEEGPGVEVEESSIALCDKEKWFTDEMLKQAGYGRIQRCQDEEAVRDMVAEEKVDVGIAVCSDTEFNYYVYNKDLDDETAQIFSEMLSEAASMRYCSEHGVDYAVLQKYDSEAIQSREFVLGKDSTTNFAYSYVLVILVFMIIIMYGMMIANSVANEKSNRTVELLVTSTNPKSLLFGKVLAATVAVLFQMSLIFASILVTYQMNREHLGDIMDGMLDIPWQVLVCFSVFGLGGFLVYAFMYGALGALVSKIEDLNKSAGTAQMLVMVIYFLTLFQMQEPDGIVIKTLSYLPVSSYSAMFIRMAMGNVAAWEIIVSAVILYVSVVGMGILAAAIFRNSTLRYGNPISITKAIRELKNGKS